VRDSVSWIINELNLDPEIVFGTEAKGWIGDNPLIHLDTNKIRNLGWVPQYSIEESIRDTVRFMTFNDWIFEGNQKQ
jgi:nucleoside-diphosphate-sugar epimerase